MKKTWTRISYISLTLIFMSAVSYSRADEIPNGLKNQAEAGLVITGGNSRSQSINLKDQSVWSLENNTYKFTGEFLSASNGGTESAYRWFSAIRYERELSPLFNLFLGQNIESDRFQNILQRYNTDLGGKYYFDKTEAFRWFSEVGYRFTRTNYVSSFTNNSYLRIYSEAERNFNPSVSAKWWVELLPNITVSKAYKFNSELSVLATLSQIFSIKTAYLLRYDNLPTTGVTYNTDSTLTNALVAKF